MKLLHSFTNHFTQDLAIDLGTANTIVYMKSEGIVVQEPSVVSVRYDSKGGYKVLAVGHEAKQMLGRTPNGIMAIRPMKDGVISNFDIAQEMLKHFITRAHQRFPFVRFKPRIVIAVPSGITQVEHRAVIEAAESAGAKEVFLIEEAIAAAIGAGLPVTEAGGNMVVDIGGGTTEVAVISLSGIVFSSSTRVGGDAMEEVITKYLKQKYNLLVGERTSEAIKLQIGSAYPSSESNKTCEVRGRDLMTGIPKTVLLCEAEIQEALSDVCQQIVHAVRNVLETISPELSADIVDKGIALAGGGSKLARLDILLREHMGLPIFHAEDPLTCVAMGTGKVLDELDLLSSIELSL